MKTIIGYNIDNVRVSATDFASLYFSLYTRFQFMQLRFVPN